MERLLRIIAPKSKIKAVKSIVSGHGARLLSVSSQHEGMQTATVLVVNEDRQELFDELQDELGGGKKWRIIVQDIEAVMPQEDDGDEDARERNAAESREELYEKVNDGARFGWPTASLIAVSAVVASVGLIQDSVTVIIGAMVIAPLLGPILAMILGTALGEFRLIVNSLISGVCGLAIGIAVGVAAGLVMQVDPGASQIASRTDVGLEGVALALASGAAAALSLTVGVSEALVGVMVAAALLPPAVAAGLMLGSGMLFLASGATLLFFVNVAAITLAGQIVFLVQGIRPRSWYARKTANQSVTASLIFWSSTLVLLVALDYLRSFLEGA